MTTAIGCGNVDSNDHGDDDGDGNGDGKGGGNCNGNSHGDGNNDEGRVASSCAGNLQHFVRGNTLPPPPLTQRKVHSPALCHGGDTAKSVCFLSRGRIPDSSPWIVICFFYNYCSVY
jgi:hypothetical protein